MKRSKDGKKSPGFVSMYVTDTTIPEAEFPPVKRPEEPHLMVEDRHLIGSRDGQLRTITTRFPMNLPPKTFSTYLEICQEPKASWRRVFSAKMELPPCLATLDDQGPNCKQNLNHICAIQAMKGFNPIAEAQKSDQQTETRRSAVDPDELPPVCLKCQGRGYKDIEMDGVHRMIDCEVCAGAGRIRQ